MQTKQRLVPCALATLALMACGGSADRAGVAAPSTTGASAPIQQGSATVPARPAAPVPTADGTTTTAAGTTTTAAGTTTTAAGTTTTAAGTTDPVSTATTTVAGRAVPSSTGRAWFAALRADGTIEAWAKDGRRAGAAACPRRTVRVTFSYPLAGCEVTAVAASASTLWFAVRDEHDVSLHRLPLGAGGSAAATVDLGTAIAGRPIVDLAVVPDDGALWLVTADDGSVGAASLWRLAAGGTPERIERGATAVAITADGSRLAYALQPDGAGAPMVVVLDLARATRRQLAFAPASAPPYSLHHLAWSRDGRRLLFSASWEGQSVWVLDVDGAERADEAVVPTAPWPAPAPDGATGVSAVQQACWGPGGQVVLGTWRYPYADEAPVAGDLFAWSSPSTPALATGVEVFGQGYGSGLACRDDGAVSLVNALPRSGTPAAGAVGDLVVIRPDATTTRLGRNYLRVFGV